MELLLVKCLNDEMMIKLLAHLQSTQDGRGDSVEPGSSSVWTDYFSRTWNFYVINVSQQMKTNIYFSVFSKRPICGDSRFSAQNYLDLDLKKKKKHE